MLYRQLFCQVVIAKFSESGNQQMANHRVSLNNYAFPEFNLNFNKYANCYKDLITSEIEAPKISDLMCPSDDNDRDYPENLQTVSSFINDLNRLKTVRTYFAKKNSLDPHIQSLCNRGNILYELRYKNNK